MAELHMVDRLMDALSALHTDVLLLSEQGTGIPTGEACPVPVFPAGETVTIADGYAWCKADASPVAYVAVAGTDSAAVDCVRLAAKLAESYLEKPAITSAQELYRGVLREDYTKIELARLADEYGIPFIMERSVLVIYCDETNPAEYIPLEPGDVFTTLDRHTSVLIKNMTQIQEADDLLQLAEAIQQTIMFETGEKPLIGIGDKAATFDELGMSLRTARKALEIGRSYHQDRTIFAYDRLVLERFMAEVPHDIAQRYHHILFNSKTKRLFNEEMISTVEMFFEKDLNLSDTARQLFIHRNTLVYRLDKIQRQIGLDLRNFEDAITFCLLFKMGRKGEKAPISRD